MHFMPARELKCLCFCLLFELFLQAILELFFLEDKRLQVVAGGVGGGDDVPWKVSGNHERRQLALNLFEDFQIANRSEKPRKIFSQSLPLVCFRHSHH